jgi:hypothetical protein
MAMSSLLAVTLVSVITWVVRDEYTRRQIEYCFVAGGIVGVGFGWASVDLLLGLHLEDVLPFWIALGSLLGCLWMSNRFIDDEDSEEIDGDLSMPMVV